MRIRVFLLVLIFTGASVAYSHGQRSVSELGSGKVFFYTAKKFGVPILKASLRIENGLSGQGKSFYQVRLQISSVALGLLFRMNNRFTSTMEAETCVPVQYVKEIDQEGLFKEKKNYLETLTFDPGRQKVLVEKKGDKEKREVSVPAETFDPLSMFARCYLKEDLPSHQDIRMTVYDGLRLRQMVFQPKQVKIKSKIYGEVEAVRIEAVTSFASFENKEGVIRIWYTNDGKKTPILMELDLPIGSVRFELDEIKEG
jgi:hypothetical protein